ncbi:endonuclease III [Aliarcobacter skirrowii]|uniref:Endonuclease III n=1 Tax=Aliarcobacter skirrowii TaxID=28200 RepID=A0A2U2BZT9_9BACT|nr:endonuclease III [Aliarcobacter skirrowii]MDX4035653.1 endonuclease III [Aliarcobacter skirrowii]MDX4038429.1 endonuclease III [Aliarcobacter skirrowii]MDX4071541.1 endonuclease III [Aliarcobacter skirrowii]PWE19736.1 endonuclease III [Aliarcobacter skirrowii]PWE20938.1 endonuclease III [Aliarcobacter skirrowii]
MKKATKADIEIIKKAFIENYSDAVTELNYRNDYELLIAIILSAQCTDRRVNLITPALFEKYPTVFDLSCANLDDVKKLINSCSFFNNKAQNIIKMAQSVVQNYEGNIPHDTKELIKLAGVGNKTANVFMIEYKQENLMAVDTHVFRVSHRLGLSDAKNVEKTEEDLVKKLKGDDLHIFHQAMVLFGRYICKAIKPDCDKCYFPQVCKSKSGFKPS